MVMPVEQYEFVRIPDPLRPVEDVFSAVKAGPELIVFGLSCVPEETVRLALDVVRKHHSVAERSDFAIVPVGWAAGILWTDLPVHLARLAASPEQHALIICSRREAQLIPPGRSLWQHLIDLPVESITKCEGIPIPSSLTDSLPALTPEQASLPSWMNAAIKAALPHSGTSPADVIALEAGLSQMRDDLDHSHSCSQSVEGRGRHQAGDYWHAIHHRREPDYGNAKYWFRQLGRHPLFKQLASRAAEVFDLTADSAAQSWKTRLTQGGWDPFAFVDLCRDCEQDGKSSLARAAQQIQWIEMLLLLQSTWNDAVGK